MNITDLAEYLRFKSPEACRAAIYRQGIPHLKLGGRLRFKRETIDAWLEAQTQVSLEQSLMEDEV
jgi:excisionase family DNA binding protein